MSLKAKLEAVIYAAEEPVTLNQLAALFAAEALEWKAEQAVATAEEAELAAEAQTTLGDQFAALEAFGSPAVEADLPAPAELEAAETVQNSDSETVSQVEREVAAESSAVVATAPNLDAESELKREARQRDREVRAVLRSLLDEMIAACALDERGIEIREIAGGYRMATKPECHDAVRMFVKSLKPAMKLSLPALETLAVIAYKQPVTAPEVNEIRGVDSSGVFGSLLARKLIATAGRKQVIGRPILYKTTKEFLLRFGLKDVAELPSMDEFEKLAEIELDEPEAGEETSPGTFDSESALESEQNLSDLPIQNSDSGTVPEPAGTLAEQESMVTEMPDLEADSEFEPKADEEPASQPAEMAERSTAEMPAETAVDFSAATEPVTEATSNV